MSIKVNKGFIQEYKSKEKLDNDYYDKLEKFKKQTKIKNETTIKSNK